MEIKKLTEEQLAARKQIYKLKRQLLNTDYKVMKYVEGLLTDAEYLPIKKQRNTWRLEINELEEKLK